ncbi:MAG TPA: hypothetical protein VGB77_07510, partial [Abditibacteriaceae bacterium]
MKFQVLYRLLFVLFLLASSTARLQAQTSVATIYDDALAFDWQNWSWDTQSNVSATTPVKAGTRSIAVTYSAAWGGLYLHSSGVSLTGATHLQFWIHGGTSGNQTLVIYAEDSTNRAPVQLPLERYIQGGAVA